MDEQFVTLRTLAAVAGENSNPVQYRCTPREMILHLNFDWDLIKSHLEQLAHDEMVSLFQGAEFTFSITQKGWDAVAPDAENRLYKKVS